MNRIILRTTTAIAAVTAAALFFPSVATAAPGALLSTAAKPNGWEIPFDDEKGQEAIHSADIVSDKDGSLKFETTPEAPRKRLYHTAGDVPLIDIVGKTLSFEQTGAGLSWQIRLTGADTIAPESENGFATLVWDAPAGNDAFRKLDATTSPLWRSTRDLPGIPKNTQKTFAELAAAAGPDAKVTHYGILLFSANPPAPATAHVDHVTFNGTTTNFAKQAWSDADAFGSLSGVSLSGVTARP
ncbi:UNVERIFIED_CONTAM: hypothetical protein DES50_10416 [Williamsia faeni]